MPSRVARLEWARLMCSQRSLDPLFQGSTFEPKLQGPQGARPGVRGFQARAHRGHTLHIIKMLVRWVMAKGGIDLDLICPPCLSINETHLVKIINETHPCFQENYTPRGSATAILALHTTSLQLHVGEIRSASLQSMLKATQIQDLAVQVGRGIHKLRNSRSWSWC